MNPSTLPEAVAACARKSVAVGLNQGTSGNVSARSQLGFWITPSGRDMTELTGMEMVEMRVEMRVEVQEESQVETQDEMRKDGTMPSLSPLKGGIKPSSEWRFHHDIYATFPEAQAIVHAHSPFAVALACLRQDLPPFHYMVAMAGGANIRCARYATFGTQALSDAIVEALQDRRACLMANHGLVAWGTSLNSALALAIEVETLCAQYLRACQIGKPVLLSAEEMAEVIEKFKGYGAQA